MPDAQVLTFIAGRVSTNIRELEGALTRVVAFSSLTGRPMSVELAQEVLKDVFPQGEPPEISIERIQEVVSDRFGISAPGAGRPAAVPVGRLPASRRHVPLPGAHRQLAPEDRATTSAAATTRPSSTRRRTSRKLIREDRGVYNLVQELTARIKQVRMTAGDETGSSAPGDRVGNRWFSTDTTPTAATGRPGAF